MYCNLQVICRNESIFGLVVIQHKLALFVSVSVDTAERDRKSSPLIPYQKIEACLGIQILPTSVMKSITPINQRLRLKNRC